MNAQYLYLFASAAYITLGLLVGLAMGEWSAGRVRRPRTRERAQVAAQLALVAATRVTR